MATLVGFPGQGYTVWGRGFRVFWRPTAVRLNNTELRTPYREPLTG